MGGMKGGVSQPPMAMNEDGVVETDPMKVREVWKRFSEGIASQVEEEEGILMMNIKNGLRRGWSA